MLFQRRRPALWYNRESALALAAGEKLPPDQYFGTKYVEAAAAHNRVWNDCYQLSMEKDVAVVLVEVATDRYTQVGGVFSHFPKCLGNPRKDWTDFVQLTRSLKATFMDRIGNIGDKQNISPKV